MHRLIALSAAVLVALWSPGTAQGADPTAQLSLPVPAEPLTSRPAPLSVVRPEPARQSREQRAMGSLQAVDPAAPGTPRPATVPDWTLPAPARSSTGGAPPTDRFWDGTRPGPPPAPPGTPPSGRDHGTR